MITATNHQRTGSKLHRPLASTALPGTHLGSRMQTWHPTHPSTSQAHGQQYPPVTNGMMRRYRASRMATACYQVPVTDAQGQHHNQIGHHTRTCSPTSTTPQALYTHRVNGRLSLFRGPSLLVLRPPSRRRACLRELLRLDLLDFPRLLHRFGWTGMRMEMEIRKTSGQVRRGVETRGFGHRSR